MSGVGRLEHKALRLWNSEANNRIVGEKAARRRGDIVTEAAELLAVEAVELHFWFPDDLRTDEPFELKFASNTKQRKSRKKKSRRCDHIDATDKQKDEPPHEGPAPAWPRRR